MCLIFEKVGFSLSNRTVDWLGEEGVLQSPLLFAVFGNMLMGANGHEKKETW